MVFALCKSSSPNTIVGPRNTLKQRGREKEGAAAIINLQLLYTQDLPPAGAMEGEHNNQRSVLNLVAVFEENRASKFPQKDKQAPYSQAAPETSQPQQLPVSPTSQGLSQMATRYHVEQEKKEEEQQGQRGLSFKCLRSFRHKISEDNWRRQRDCSLETDSKISEDNWRRQRDCSLETDSKEPEEKKIALELLETEQAYVNRLHLLDQHSSATYAQARDCFLEVLERLKLYR
ncbi:PREDICTED: FYVE, RhoGEF and PH domain-containing protein 2-like [Calidris pugnax]|uniref:FYVE, RhoGEF and PH domain-containing protein 2-like n=1 Tax=Calidris pugnax TaxID=198806 RepID=UPI00071DB85A|nr:PREDICTED: FYVE, RhoGEF and PH domain-containing protein 2-like [Calidris pugnax]